MTLGRATHGTVAHLVVRGTYIPGTVRCTPENEYQPPSLDSLSRSFNTGLFIYCYTDIRVNEYYVGTGPSVLTVLVAAQGHGSATKRWMEPAEEEALRINWEIALTYGGSQGADDTSVVGPPGGIGGREAILFIGPLDDAALEAWRVYETWDVQRRADGWIHAVHPDRPGYAPKIRDDEDFEWLLLKMQVNLATMQQEAITGQKARTAANHGYTGPVGRGEYPRLVTDANDLSEYYHSIGALEPAKPPPASRDQSLPTGEPGPQPTPEVFVPCGANVPSPSLGVLMAMPDVSGGPHSRTYQLRLYEGWNLVGLPGEPTRTAISDIVGDTPVDLVLSYDGGTEPGLEVVPSPSSGLYWLYASRFNGKWSGDLTDIHGGNGYWFLAESDAVLEVSLYDGGLPALQAIDRGWNLLSVWDRAQRPQGAPIDQTDIQLRFNDGFRSYSYGAAYSYNPELNRWKKLLLDDDQAFEVGSGYWLRIIGPSVLCP